MCGRGRQQRRRQPAGGHTFGLAEAAAREVAGAGALFGAPAGGSAGEGRQAQDGRVAGGRAMVPGVGWLQWVVQENLYRSVVPGLEVALLGAGLRSPLAAAEVAEAGGAGRAAAGVAGVAGAAVPAVAPNLSRFTRDLWGSTQLACRNSAGAAESQC